MFGFFKKKTPVPAKAVPPPLPPLPVAAPVADPPPARQGENGFHLNQELVPETELEQLLWNAKQGHATYEEVINGFLQSQVKILDTEFDPAQRNLLHRPFSSTGPTTRRCWPCSPPPPVRIYIVSDTRNTAVSKP